MTDTAQHTSIARAVNAGDDIQPVAPAPPPVKFQTMRSYVVLRAYFLAGELGICTLLEDGPRHIDDLARSAGVEADSLYRLLRMLAAHSVFTEVSERTFANSPPSLALRPGGLWQATLELPRVIRTGKTGYELAFGVDIWGYLDSRPELSAIFSQMVVASHEGESQVVAAAYDWSQATTVLDIGGGLGELMVAILEAHPHLSGVLIERGAVVSEARAALAERGLADRCEVLEADIRRPLPAVAADIAILSHIIHDWDDRRALNILRNAVTAIRPGGRLLILEGIVLPGDVADPNKVNDVLMMVSTGGRERTEAEYRDLLSSAGLHLTQVVQLPPTEWGTHVIEAALEGT